MVKPLFETNSSEKKEELVIKPLLFPEETKPAKQIQPISEPSALFKMDKKDIHGLVAKTCNRIAKLNKDLYESNALYCQTQCSLLLPLNSAVVIDWGNKHLERMRVTTNEVTRHVKIVTETQCNEYVEDTLDKLKAKPNWLSGMFGSKTEWIIKAESHLRTISNTLMTVLPVLDNLSSDMNRHSAKLVLKLAIISALSDVVGVIPDSVLESAVHSRKVIIQQSIMQAQLSIQELINTKKYIITQKQQIDQILNVSIPMFNSSRNNT